MNFDQVKTVSNTEGGKLVLVCEEGSVWVTAKNDSKDYVLKAGSQIEFDETQTDIVLQGLSDALKIELKRCA